MENKPDTTRNTLPEAPASATVKIKSKNGFEYLFTLRDEKASTLMYKIEAMEDKWMSLGWVPLSQNPPKNQKQKDYVPDRLCPNDKGKLVFGNTSQGKKFIRCENQKWNFTLKKAEGCLFIEWI